jgi:ParB family chromosome partitioning protein
MAKRKAPLSEADAAFRFQEPHTGEELIFTVVPTDRLEVIPHQRKPSSAHVQQLATSIQRIGFLVPLVVVPKAGARGRYVIIDGQHRYLAARELGIDRLPAVVAPESLADRMMNLNVEKEPNIRERAYVAVAIYRQHLQARPDVPESAMVDAIERPYYVTLGLAYEQQERMSGSAFEAILRRCDGFLPEPLHKAYEVRRARAARVLEADRLVHRIADRMREKGTWHPYAYHQIVATANPYRRKRAPVEFDPLFDALVRRLEELEQHPELVFAEEVA